jgi:hypothetical protein
MRRSSVTCCQDMKFILNWRKNETIASCLDNDTNLQPGTLVD